MKEKKDGKLKTKLTLSTEKRKSGDKLTKTRSEKEIFKREVALYKARKYTNSELAEFYGVSEKTIENVVAEVRKDGLKIYNKNRVGLIEDQILELDLLIEEAYKDLEETKDKDLKIKLRKEIKENLAYKAKIQGLLVENVNVNNVGNPTDVLLQQFNIFKPDNNASNT